MGEWPPTDCYTYDDARLEAYSNADEVELYLNGQSLGAKKKPANDAARLWDVTFAQGTLRAVALPSMPNAVMLPILPWSTPMPVVV